MNPNASRKLIALNYKLWIETLHKQQIHRHVHIIDNMSCWYFSFQMMSLIDGYAIRRQSYIHIENTDVDN